MEVILSENINLLRKNQKFVTFSGTETLPGIAVAVGCSVVTSTDPVVFLATVMLEVFAGVAIGVCVVLTTGFWRFSSIGKLDFMSFMLTAAPFRSLYIDPILRRAARKAASWTGWTDA